MLTHSRSSTEEPLFRSAHRSWYRRSVSVAVDLDCLDRADADVKERPVSNVVAYEVVDRVAHVIIDRPDVRNAMDLAVFDELHGRAEEIAEDPHVGAVVLRGRGGNFSSGLDVSIFNEVAEEGSQDEEAVASLISRLQSAFNAYEDLAVPTIAAIEGYALGAGLQLALACHLRMAAPSAQLSV